MSKNFIMGIPPQLKWKLSSSMNAQKSAVERFSNLLQGYKSMKIVMASFLPFKFLDQFAIFSQMSVNWPFLESFLIFRKVDRTSKVYLYSAVNLDSVEVVCLDPGCMKHFTNVQCLKAHVKTCHQFVTCETCGKKELKKNIKRHLQSHETSSSSEAFECEQKDCGSKFTTKSNLEKHVKVVHFQEKPFVCGLPDCGMRFSYKHVRDNHEKTGLHVYTHGDFEESDEQFRSRPRGGCKRKCPTIEMLVRKRVTPPNQLEHILFGEYTE